MKQEISNDQVLSDSVFHITQLGRKLQELLRDGKFNELESALSIVHKASERGILRLNTIAFREIPLPDGYK